MHNDCPGDNTERKVNTVADRPSSIDFIPDCESMVRFHFRLTMRDDVDQVCPVVFQLSVSLTTLLRSPKASFIWSIHCLSTQPDQWSVNGRFLTESSGPSLGSAEVSVKAKMSRTLRFLNVHGLGQCGLWVIVKPGHTSRMQMRLFRTWSRHCFQLWVDV